VENRSVWGGQFSGGLIDTTDKNAHKKAAEISAAFY
jgi:hypothetical protein